MVKKLYKHELIALMRLILPLNAICIGLSLLLRICQTLGSLLEDVTLFYLVTSVVTMMYVVSIIAITFITFGIVIVRFYRHLLSTEGYLSLTIPVSTSAHIICKLVCGMLMSLISGLSMILSIFIVGSGFAEFWTSFGNILEDIGELIRYVGSGGFALYIVEIVLLVLTSLAYVFLIAYASMAMGQRAKKSRGVLSVVWYFVFSAIRQIVMNAITIIASLLFGNSNAIEMILTNRDSFFDFLLNSGLHWILWSSILITVIWGAVYYVITQISLKKHLNLE